MGCFFPRRKKCDPLPTTKKIDLVHPTPTLPSPGQSPHLINEVPSLLGKQRQQSLNLTWACFQVTDDDHHRLFPNCLWLGELGMNQSSTVFGFDHESVRQFPGTERLQWEVCVQWVYLTFVYDKVKSQKSNSLPLCSEEVHSTRCQCPQHQSMTEET